MGPLNFSDIGLNLTWHLPVVFDSANIGYADSRILGDVKMVSLVHRLKLASNKCLSVRKKLNR